MARRGLALLASLAIATLAASCSSPPREGFAPGAGADSGGSSGGGSSSGSSSGGSSSGADGGRGADAGVDAAVPPAVQMACASFASAACAQVSACTPLLLKAVYGDVTTCTARTALACTPVVGPSGSTTTATQITACATALKSATCTDWADGKLPSACRFAGTLAAGAPCGADAQCQSGYCELAAGSICGTCASRATAGQGCSGVACDYGLVCFGKTPTCVAPGAAGAACSATAPCQGTLACVASKCATPVAVGGSCPNGTECDAAKGDYCNTSTKKCAAITTAATGQSCGVVGSGLVSCVGGDSCANVDSSGKGTCHVPAADGAACGVGVACVAPAACTSDARCTLPAPTSCH